MADDASEQGGQPRRIVFADCAVWPGRAITGADASSPETAGRASFRPALWPVTGDRIAVLRAVGTIVAALRRRQEQPPDDRSLADLVCEVLAGDPGLAACVVRRRDQASLAPTTRAAAPARGLPFGAADGDLPDGGEIEVDVEGRVVRLTGLLRSAAARHRAGVLASLVPGGRKLINGLRVASQRPGLPG